MKIGYKALLASLLTAALLVPAATAESGNGKGNGNGPPAWAGGGNGGPTEKPAPSAKGQAKKAENAERKQERRAARDIARQSDDDGPKHDNPAWVCKFEREQMGDEAFAEEYATEENTANAFGKCVSQEAHDRDGVAVDDESEPSVPNDSEEGDTGSAGAVAAFRAFIQSLVQMVF